jgi:hypothetical protein
MKLGADEIGQNWSRVLGVDVDLRGRGMITTMEFLETDDHG